MLVNKLKLKQVVPLFILIIIFLAGFTYLSSNQTSIEGKVFNIDLKTSATYDTPILINDLPSSPNNWSWAKSQGYCTGSGTSNDPYVIQNNFFNNTGAISLSIYNSRKYFRIFNCEFIGGIIGIFLQNVSSGVLQENFFSNYVIGVDIANCSFITFTINEIISSTWGLLIDNVKTIVATENTIRRITTAALTTNDCWLSIFSNNYIFDNFGVGMYFTLGHSNTISLNTIYNNSGNGIQVAASNENAIVSNNVYDNSNGIYLESSSEFNTISKNILNRNSIRGIYLNACHNNTISENVANHNAQEGIWCTMSSDTIISLNTVFNNSLYGIRVNSGTRVICSGNTVSYNRDFGIRVFACDDNIIQSNYVHHNARSGIYLFSSSIQNIVKWNTVSYNNESGILIGTSSNNNLITANTANYNEQHGIYMLNSDSCVILDNIANNNELNGIHLENSNDNFISYNTANFNNHGIYLDTSNDNFILYNNLASNIVCYNETGSTGNIFEGNTCIAIAPAMDPFVLGLIIGLVVAGGAFGIAIGATFFIKKKKRTKE